MALVNGGYLHCTDIKEIFGNSLKVAKEKIGYGPLKNSGERSRAILALLFRKSWCPSRVAHQW